MVSHRLWHQWAAVNREQKLVRHSVSARHGVDSPVDNRPKKCQRTCGYSNKHTVSLCETRRYKARTPCLYRCQILLSATGGDGDIQRRAQRGAHGYHYRKRHMDDWRMEHQLSDRRNSGRHDPRIHHPPVRLGQSARVDSGRLGRNNAGGPPCAISPSGR